MAKAFDFKRLKRSIVVYGVVQVFLIGLLIYMAIYFQAALQAEGMPQRFFKSIVAAFVIQLALFYPINKFAASEAKREVDASAVGLGADELKAFRNKRMLGDTIKWAIFIFYIIFFYKAPQNKTILCVTFFSFILTVLTYFQCFNFSAKRLMKDRL
jgi:hypothetical protein